MYPVTSRSLSRLLTLLPVLLALACTQDQPTAPDASILTAKGGGGGGPAVDAADPNNAPQDTTLDVRVIGSGFDNGSAVKLLLNGQSTPKIVTNSTQFVDRNNLIANITIVLDAEVALYDIEVMTRRGKKGIGTELFSVREKGSRGSGNVTWLTNVRNVYDGLPVFSPDGSTVLFTRTLNNGQGQDILYLVPASGGKGERLFPEGTGDAAVADWYMSTAVDRKVFVFGETPGYWSVWVIDDGVLGEVPGSDSLSTPRWFPDGRHIAVQDGFSHTAMRIDAAGVNAAVTLTDSSQILAGMPDVSPDGTWLIFAGQTNEGQEYDAGNNSIWVAPVAGDPALKPYVEVSNGQGQAPAWSPDGQWLAFQSNRALPGDAGSRGYNIWIVQVFDANGDPVPAGTGLQPVPRGTGWVLHGTFPEWSPDGSVIVFSARRFLHKSEHAIAAVEIF